MFALALYGADGTPGGAPTPFIVKKDGDEIYFGYDAAKKQLTISTEGAPKGSLAKLRAHWVSRDTILWNVVGSPKYSYALHYSSEAALALDATGITGGAEIPLAYNKSGPGGALLKKFPHLGGYTALKLNPDDLPTLRVPDILKGQVAVTVRDATGKLVDAAGVQIPGVLDDLYTYVGPLGATFENGAPTLRVWAPPAKSVTLHLYDDSTTTTDTTRPMAWDAQTGVWRVRDGQETAAQWKFGGVPKGATNYPRTFDLADTGDQAQQLAFTPSTADVGALTPDDFAQVNLLIAK